MTGRAPKLQFPVPYWLWFKRQIGAASDDGHAIGCYQATLESEAFSLSSMSYDKTI
jgi:hypothetical protein